MRFGSEVVLDAWAYVRAYQGNVIAIDYLRAHAYGAVRFHAPPHFFIEVANALAMAFWLGGARRTRRGRP